MLPFSTRRNRRSSVMVSRSRGKWKTRPTITWGKITSRDWRPMLRTKAPHRLTDAAWKKLEDLQRFTEVLRQASRECFTWPRWSGPSRRISSVSERRISSLVFLAVSSLQSLARRKESEAIRLRERKRFTVSRSTLSAFVAFVFSSARAHSARAKKKLPTILLSYKKQPTILLSYKKQPTI